MARVLRAAWIRLRGSFGRGRSDEDFSNELESHLQMHIDDNLRAGMPLAEARRQARMKLGGVEQTKQAYREGQRLAWLEHFFQDIRLGARNLRRNPGFTVVAVLTLALGLAAVGMTFAVVETVLLRPLPFANSDRIVTVSQKVPFFGSSPTVVTAGEFQAWKTSGLFESAALMDTAEYTLQGPRHPEQIYGAAVTPEFFRVFGLQPIVGRGFSAENAEEEHSNAIVLSHELWARHFGSDRNVIGKTIHLNGTSRVVFGVMPAGFAFPRFADVSSIMNWAPERAEFWIPLAITPKLVEEGNFNYYALGRLRNGVTRERAAAQFRGTAVHLFKEKEVKYPQYRSVIEQMLGTLVVYVTPLRDTMAWGVRDSLWMLFTAAALLLVLVLFNLGNLLLARNAQRLREYTVRRALGASRWQLFRQSVFEQVVLVGLASAFAGALMAWGIAIVRATADNKLPRLYELHFSFGHFAFVLGIAFVTAVTFGALSQLLLSETMLAAALNSQSRSSTGDRRTSQLKFLLLAAEIAVSIVLLVGAGLLFKSFQNVIEESPGFNSQHLLTMSVAFGSKTDKPEKRVQHIRELLAKLRGFPDAVSASLVSRLPLTGDSDIHDVRALGRPLPREAERISAEYRVIDAAYFRTMEIPVIAGRELRPDDPAAFSVINQKMAESMWPGENAIGKQFTDGDHPPFNVIGVVGDVHNGSLEKPEMMQFYRLITADPYYANIFVIRSAHDPESLLTRVQQAVWQLDSSEPVMHAQAMERLLAAVTLRRRFESASISSFAAFALFLSALGLFSVASLSAARRKREFGIRLALGATGGQIVRLELARTAWTVMAGLATGIVASLAAARAMAGLLYQVTPWNWEIFGVAALVLTASALLAGWLPARRAARTDPASALRIE